MVEWQTRYFEVVVSVWLMRVQVPSSAPEKVRFERIGLFQLCSLFVHHVLRKTNLYIHYSKQKASAEKIKPGGSFFIRISAQVGILLIQA